MSNRHKRPKRLVRTDLFVIDAEKINATLMRYAHDIDPSSPRHQAVMNVQHALMTALLEINGQEAPWTMSTPASWGPVQN